MSLVVCKPFQQVDSHPYSYSSVLRLAHPLNPACPWVCTWGNRFVAQSSNLTQNLIWKGDYSTHPSVELDRNLPTHRGEHILKHLPGIHLHNQHTASQIGQLLYPGVGERGNRDWTQQADRDPFFPSSSDR